jgi:predicted kinase
MGPTGSVLLVAGLPGSGKSTYLRELELVGWLKFDDFKANAIGNSSTFQNARRFEELVECLRDGRRCVVSDIDFCKTDSREEAERILRARVPNLELAWCFFANDEEACETNAKRRNRTSLPRDLAKLKEYSEVYNIPEAATIRDVVDSKKAEMPSG